MSDLNKVTLIGHLGADPEMRVMDSGKAVTSLRIATNSGSKDREDVTWHRISLFGASAVFAEKNAHKGDYVYVEGRITNRTWKNREGQEVTTTEIQVNESNWDGFKLLRTASERAEVSNELSAPVEIPA